MSSLVKIRLADGILELTLDDPSSKNALSLKAARELRSNFHSKNFDALVFTSVGRVFCSGGQLSDYAQMTEAHEGQKVNDEIRDILNELAHLDRPTIACLGGDAFGGGVELASCFDLIIAAPHIVLALWQRKIGLSYGWGGGARIEDRIGRANLKRLSLTTESISVYEALGLGLVDLSVRESVLLPTAHATAKKLIAIPAEPVKTLKNFDASTEAPDFNSLWWNKSHRAVLAKRKR